MSSLTTRTPAIQTTSSTTTTTSRTAINARPEIFKHGICDPYDAYVINTNGGQTHTLR